MSKKIVLMFSIVGVMALSLASCGKKDHEPAIQQKISVQLAENQDYVYVLPESMRHDAYRFTTQASHSSISVINSNNGQQIYQYTPGVNYTGVDQVVVTNTKDETEHHQCGGQNSCGPHFGDCMGVQDSRYEITFNIVVRGNDVSSVK